MSMIQVMADLVAEVVKNLVTGQVRLSDGNFSLYSHKAERKDEKGRENLAFF